MIANTSRAWRGSAADAAANSSRDTRRKRCSVDRRNWRERCLLHGDHLRAIHGVARKAEVPDAGDAVVAPGQGDEVSRRSLVASLEHEERRPTIDGAGNHPPVQGPVVTVEVFRYFAVASQPQPIHEI